MQKYANIVAVHTAYFHGTALITQHILVLVSHKMLKIEKKLPRGHGTGKGGITNDVEPECKRKDDKLNTW